MLKHISNFTGDSRRMEVPLMCITKTHLLSTFTVNGVHSAYEIVRNDDQFDKFKSLAILYNSKIFKRLEQKIFNGVRYIKLAATICSLSDFIMLIVYKKSNSNTAEFFEYITYLVITKHADCILGDFNEDSFSDEAIKISLQSLGISQVVLEAA